MPSRTTDRIGADKPSGNVTGDGTSVGFFIPLPEDLAHRFPNLSPYDTSPPHITFLQVGRVSHGDEQRLLDVAASVFSEVRGPVRVALGGLGHFINPASSRTVAYCKVRFSHDMAAVRWKLRDRLLDAGFDVQDSFPLVYNPHVTLAYMDGTEARYQGGVPEGGFVFDEVQVWGLPKVVPSIPVSSMIRQACIIAAGEWGGSSCLVKNRDRNYVPKLKIIHEEIDGTEVCYILDTGTDWSEGLNEYGIGVINSALQVGRDEAEKKIVKEVGRKSKDGDRIRKALSKSTLPEAVDTLCKYKGGVKGHTLVSDGKRTFAIEQTSKHDCIVKEYRSGDLHVRTNHGHSYDDAGYTEGEDYISSIYRKDHAERILRDVEKPEALAPALMNARKEDRSHPNNLVRDTENMSTTTQIVMDLSNRRLLVYLIPKKVVFEGVENRLPEKRKPRVKVDVYEYENVSNKKVKVVKKASQVSTLETLWGKPLSRSAGLFQAPPAMVSAITEWAQGVRAATVMEKYKPMLTKAQDNIAAGRKREIHARALMGKVLRELESGTEETLTDAVYALLDEGPRLSGRRRVSDRDLQHFGTPKHSVLVGKVKRWMGDLDDFLKREHRRRLERLDEIQAQMDEVRPYFKANIKPLRSGKTTRHFPMDLSGWRYSNDRFKRAVATMPEWQSLQVDLFAEANVSGTLGDWHPVKRVISISLNQPIEEIARVVRHELQHATQTFMASVQGIDSLSVKPRPGMPSRRDMTPEHQIGNRRRLLDIGESYALDDAEFATKLADAVHRTKRALVRLDGSPEAQRAFLTQVLGGKRGDVFPEIGVWKKHAPGKWKKAVKEFTKAFPVLAGVRLASVWRHLSAARYKNKKKVKTKDGDEAVIYEYSERQIQHRNREKAKRVEKLRKNIDKLRAEVKKDLASADEKQRLTALAICLIDATYERVGNDGSAAEGHFGVTGWKKEHISFSGSKATIKYVGKSGVKQSKEVTNASLVQALKKAVEGKKKGDPIFCGDGCSITSKEVNAYLKTFDVTAKDLRGFHANREMQERLKAIRSKGGKIPEDKKERERRLKEEFKQALEETAEAVGHEPSTLKSQYLVPGVEDEYLKDGTVSDTLNKKGHKHYRNICPSCGGFSQCRCMGVTTETFDLCFACSEGLVETFSGLSAAGHVATKTEREKLEENAESMIKRDPKKKPPRHDLRRTRVTDEDPDTKKPSADNDKDLSLNYKKRGASLASILLWRQETSHVAGKRKAPKRIQKKREKRKNQGEHKPGDVWKSDGGGWVGMNPDGVAHSFDTRDRAEAYAKGKGDERKNEKREDELDQQVLDGDVPEADERDPTDSEVSGGENPEEHEEEAEEEPDAEEVAQKAPTGVDPSLQALDDMSILFNVEIGSDLSPQSRKIITDVMDGASPEDAQALAQAFMDSLERLNTKWEPDGSKGFSSTTLAQASKALSKGTTGFKGSPESKGKALAEYVVAAELVANPSRVAGKAVSSAEKTQEQLEERAQESFRQYRDASPEFRQEAINQIHEQMKSLVEDSHEYREYDKILDGLALAALVNDEEVSARLPDGDEVSLRREPTRSFRSLAKHMVSSGRADMLLVSTDKLHSVEGRSLIKGAMEQMTDEELLDFVGATDEDYNPWEPLRALLLDEDEEYTLTKEQRRYVRDLFQRLILNEMTTGQELVMAFSGSGYSSPSWGGYTPRRPTFRSQREEVQWILDEALQSDGVLSAREDLERNLMEDSDFLKCVKRLQDDGIVGQEAFDRCREKPNKIASTDAGKALEIAHMRAIYDLSLEQYGDPDPGDPTIAQVRAVLDTGDLSELDKRWVRKDRHAGLLHTWRKLSNHLSQCSVYTGDTISGGPGYALAGPPWHSHTPRRNLAMAGFKLTASAASRIAQDLDKLAALAHEQYEVLGIPEWLGTDFARRASLLADHIEQQADLPITKRALSEMDIVDEASFGPDNFDPEEIGEEVAGPQEGDSDEPYMNGEFSQQENRELRERSQNGDLGMEMNEEPQAPTPGKQASVERLAAMANSLLIKSLAEKQAAMVAAATALAESDEASVATLTASVLNLANKVKAAHAALSSAPYSAEIKASTEAIAEVVDEVLPHVTAGVEAGEVADVSNLLRMASQIVSANSKV